MKSQDLLRRATLHRPTLARFALLRSALAGIALTTCAARPGAAPAATAAAPSPSEQALIAEARSTLTTLVAVDTSHGHETELLRPIAERFRAAGLPVELLESAEGRGNLVARYK